MTLLLSQLTHLAILYVIGYMSYVLGKKIKLPSPALLGPLFGIGILRIFEVGIPMPPGWFSMLVQLFLGIILGLGLNRDHASEITKMVKPIMVLITWALAVTFSLGFLLNRFDLLDLYTAILSASPGGLPEMTILAADTAADLPVVVITHSLRMVSTVGLVPIILMRLKQNKQGAERASDVPSEADMKPINSPDTTAHEPNPGMNHKQLAIRIAVVGLVGIVGGLLADYLMIPAGHLVGSFVFVSIVSVTVPF